MALFGNIGPFDEKVELLKDYTDRCDAFLVANRIDDELQASLFLAVMGADTFKLVKNVSRSHAKIKNLCSAEGVVNRALYSKTDRDSGALLILDFFPGRE